MSKDISILTLLNKLIIEQVPSTTEGKSTNFLLHMIFFSLKTVKLEHY